MTINYTTLLSLGQPVTGSESGDWGNDVNYAITDYLDAAVAGTQTITNDANVTLSLTQGTYLGNNLAQVGAGTTGSAQYAVILCSGARTAARNVVVPSSSRNYIVINSTTGGFGIVVKGSATTGVTVAAGETALIVWNSAAAVADYVKVASSLISGTVTSVGGTGTVNGITLTGTVTSTGNLTLGGALTGVNLASQVTGTLPIANGGTGQTTAAAAITALTGAQTSGRYLRSDGTNSALAAIQAGDVPTLNQNTTGTAAGLSTTLAIASGGTGQTTAAAAITALTGTQTSGQYLRSNGTNSVLAAIQAGDVPTLNQNTTGTAAGLSATLAIASGGTGATSLAGANIPVVNVANTFTGTQTFAGTSSATAVVLSDAAETTTISATAATGTIAYDITTQSVLYYTTNASANWTVNFRASSGTTLNAIMSAGQSMTVAFLVTQGSTAYYNSAVQVDGSAVTPKWQGGTAPTAGNASSIDIYSYTIIKTGSAAFTVLASQTKFA
jgi:hypothetical protein